MTPNPTNEERELLEQPRPPMTWSDRLLMAIIYLCAIAFGIWMGNNTYAFIQWLNRIFN